MMIGRRPALSAAPDRGSRRKELQRLAAANQADREAFDFQRLSSGIDDDRLVARAFGDQLDHVAAFLVAFDGDVIIDPRDHDLAVAGLAGGVHGEQVAVEDAGVDHRVAAHLEQVIGFGREEMGIELVAVLDVFDGEDRAAGGDAADQRQAELLDQANAAR